MSDVGESIYKILCKKYKGTINLVSGKVVSFYKIANKIKNIYGVKIMFTKRNGNMPHNGYRAFNNKYLKKIIIKKSFIDLLDWLDKKKFIRKFNMKVELIDLKSRYKFEKEINSVVKKILSKGNLVLTSELEDFENKICNYTNSKYCLGLNSGTDALMMSLWSLGIGKGDEVITSDIIYCNCRRYQARRCETSFCRY